MHWKGYALGIAAFARALSEAEAEGDRSLDGATYTLYGDGPERRRLAALARRLGVADRVALPGRLPRERLAEAGPLRFVWLDVPVPELERRLAARRHRYMPASLLPSQLATLEPPQADEPALRVDGGAPLHEILATVRAWLPASTFSRAPT